MVSVLWFHLGYLLLLQKSCGVHGGLGDYLNGILGYFGGHADPENQVYDTFLHPIPYEVSQPDEQFINEAVKLTGVALSELDTCQQRVVLKLKSDCGRMNEEELAKMAVHLLNCQSYVEGRTMYPCTEEMSIKQCTSDMDSDTWISYHLMSNRARAVCYTVRQAQFRGLAERTVNRLMEASQNQLISLDRIATNQESILDLAETTHQSLFDAQTELANRQKELQQAQLHGQLALEDNIRRLVDEKRIIAETRDKLTEMTREIQIRLENSAKTIVDQNAESKTNHKQLIDDVVTVQTKANQLFGKIDSYSDVLVAQNVEFKRQYDATLQNLREINETVRSLVDLIGRTRQRVEEPLSRIVAALGGADEAAERLYLILLHVTFLLMSMLTCCFLSTEMTVRFCAVALPAVNLALALLGGDSLTFPGLLATVAILLFARNVFNWTVSIAKRRKICQTDDVRVHVSQNDSDDRSEYRYSAPTPPASRSVTPLRHKVTCRGVTRAGTPCKMTSPVGRNFCHRHQRGDSILE